ncbi:MAG: hypothetical protein LBV67_11350 [Streptococcaceae bacterium]|jgi:hypothetical protein|nr:hypothetical protein [Streptococcaceae bacterium]
MGKVLRLKPMIGRELANSEEWVVVGENSFPFVVEKELAEQLMSGELNKSEINHEIIDFINDEKLLLSEGNQFISLVENNKLSFRIVQRGIFTLGVLSFVIVIISVFLLDIPTGNKLIYDGLSLPVNLVILVVFSTVTTFFHELMHYFFSQPMQTSKRVLHFHLLKGVASVEMSYIWAWSFFARLMAIFSGILLDLILLAILTVIQYISQNLFFELLRSVLWVRIIWQFQFQKSYDGFLLISILKDDLFFNENRKYQFYKWIGRFITLLLVVFWALPFIFAIIR